MRYPIKDKFWDGEWTRLRSLPTGTQGEPAPIDIDIDIDPPPKSCVYEGSDVIKISIKACSHVIGAVKKQNSNILRKTSHAMQCTYNSTCSSVGAFPHTIKSGHLACSSVYDVIQRTCPTIWRKQLPSAEWCHPIRYDTISLRDSDGNIASFCPLVACLRRICFSSIQ